MKQIREHSWAMKEEPRRNEISSERLAAVKLSVEEDLNPVARVLKKSSILLENETWLSVIFFFFFFFFAAATF